MNRGISARECKPTVCDVLALTLAFALTGAAEATSALARPACGTVEVVYADGRPVQGAEVTHRYTDPYTNEDPTDGQSWETGRDGRVCEQRLLEPGFLEVDAPLALGGWCAAREELRYRGARPSTPNPKGVTRVALHMHWFRRTAWRGRVLGPGGHPIEGARILVRHVFPDGTNCSEGPRRGWYTAAADGSFQLESLPKGAIDLLIEAKGYATQAFEVRVPGPPRNLSLESGVEWKGRVLDPDGVPIADCSMRLHQIHNLTDIQTRCAQEGFAFHNVPVGEAKLYVRVGRLPWSGDGRGLMVPVHIAHGEQRREDVHWPVGLDVSGVVVDEAGIPIPGAYLRTFSQDQERSADEGSIDTRADELGRFTFHHLASGTWNLMAGHNVLFGTTIAVTAGTSDVRIVLRKREGR